MSKELNISNHSTPNVIVRKRTPKVTQNSSRETRKISKERELQEIAAKLKAELLQHIQRKQKALRTCPNTRLSQMMQELQKDKLSR